jgi:hypothetical protein
VGILHECEHVILVGSMVSGTNLSPQSYRDGNFPYVLHVKRLHGIHSFGVCGNTVPSVLQLKFKKNPCGHSSADCTGHRSHEPFSPILGWHPLWYEPMGQSRDAPIPSHDVLLTQTLSLSDVHASDSVKPWLSQVSEHCRQTPLFPTLHPERNIPVLQVGHGRQFSVFMTVG